MSQYEEDDYGGYEADFQVFNKLQFVLYKCNQKYEDEKEQRNRQEIIKCIETHFGCKEKEADYNKISEFLEENKDHNRKIFFEEFLCNLTASRVNILCIAQDDMAMFADCYEYSANILGDLLQFVVRTRDKAHFAKLIELVGPYQPDKDNDDANFNFKCVQARKINPTFSTKEYTLWEFCVLSGCIDFVKLLKEKGYAPATPPEVLCHYARYLSLHDDLEYSFLDVSILAGVYQHYNPTRRCLPAESALFILADEDIAHRKKWYGEMLKEEEEETFEGYGYGDGKEVRKYLSDIIHDVPTDMFALKELLVKLKTQDGTSTLRVIAAAVCLLRKPENAKLGEKTFEWLQCLNILMQPINMRLDHEDGHQYFKIFAEFVIVVDDALIMRLMLDNKDFRNLLLLASSDEDDENRLLIDGLTGGRKAKSA